MLLFRARQLAPLLILNVLIGRRHNRFPLGMLLKHTHLLRFPKGHIRNRESGHLAFGADIRFDSKFILLRYR